MELFVYFRYALQTTINMPLIAELADEGEISDSSKTFVFEDEGHTLGNILKSIIGRYRDVEFCGYTVPHPSESVMHLRVQASKNVKAIDILVRGLDDLVKVCDHTTETFKNAMLNHDEKLS